MCLPCKINNIAVLPEEIREIDISDFLENLGENSEITIPERQDFDDSIFGESIFGEGIPFTQSMDEDNFFFQRIYYPPDYRHIFDPDYSPSQDSLDSQLF